ncbi:hypothetical protein BDR26DRAFT_903242 [Obelidium mucronatum]|nr:hypothetical protein BDR26DRAFT_903242 [Obelidium mucronatum]
MVSLAGNDSSTIALGIYIFCVVIALIQVAYFLNFVIRRESVIDSKGLTSPFNVTLLGSILGIMLYSIFNILLIILPASAIITHEVLRFLATISLVIMESSYMYYSYIRSKDVLRFHKPTLKMTQYLSASAPVIFLFKIIASALFEFNSSPTSENRIVMKYLVIASLNLGGMLTSLFDTGLLISFIMYLRRTLNCGEIEEMKPEFRVIAWHGLLTCSICYLAVFDMSVVGLSIGFGGLDLEDYSITALTAIFAWMMVMIMGVLIRMKVKLFEAKEDGKTHVVEEIKKRAKEAEESYVRQGNLSTQCNTADVA